MKVISTLVAGPLFVAVIAYFGFGAINEHIDSKSGAIVEEVLSDNAISQLKLLSEVRLLLNAGEVSQANNKLSESVDTLVYILQKNCTLPKCEEALRNYERK